MRILPLLACLLLSTSFAQDIEFQFHIHQMEPTIGQALEGRLIAGGDAAAEAVAKLPDFVRQGRVEEAVALSLTIMIDVAVQVGVDLGLKDLVEHAEL